MLFSPSRPFGKYEIDTLIGRGGMGEVWKGRSLLGSGISKTIALKCVRSGLAGDPALGRQLAREVEATFGFRHPNIVYVFDFARVKGKDCIVMEWVEGVNLAQMAKYLRFSRGSEFSVDDIQHIAISVLRALDYAHHCDDFAQERVALVHRDISPQNILISTLGEVKVSDFGIARTCAEECLGSEWDGKSSYVAPEQHSGHYDHRVDLYSLGSVLYELLTKQIFRGHDVGVGGEESHARTIARIVSCKGDPEQAEIVAKLLSRNPEDRFSSAREALGAVMEVSQADALKGSVSLGENAAAIVSRGTHSGAELRSTPSKQTRLTSSRFVELWERTTRRRASRKGSRLFMKTREAKGLVPDMRKRLSWARELVGMWSSAILFVGGVFNVPKWIPDLEPAVTHYESKYGLSPCSVGTELLLGAFLQPEEFTRTPRSNDFRPGSAELEKKERGGSGLGSSENAPYVYWQGGLCGEPGES